MQREEEKEEVKKKIIRMCEARGISIPKVWNYKNVKSTVHLIRNTCPFCKQHVGHGTNVICNCEIKMTYRDDQYSDLIIPLTPCREKR